MFFTNFPAGKDAYAASLKNPASQTQGAWWQAEALQGRQQEGEPLWGREFSLTWEFLPGIW